jgi:lipoate-protein ligase B
VSYRVRLLNRGFTDYLQAWREQQLIAEAVRDGEPEALILIQHAPVYTFGRRVRPEHLLASLDALEARGATVIESDRGGDITFHGPGQLVAYPILDLKRRGLGPREYVRGLEETIILTLQHLGIDGKRWAGRPGVWVGGSKIAALGVRVSGGVTTHGLALNVETDLSWFEAIVPCGIPGTGVTSIERELGSSPGMCLVENELEGAFEDVFDSELEVERAPYSSEMVLARGH